MNLDQKQEPDFMVEKQNGSWANSKERKRLKRLGTLLFCHKKQAKTHRLMALPIVASSNPTIEMFLEVPKSELTQFTHSHLVNIPQNVGPNENYTK
jgi:hypothetical protein